MATTPVKTAKRSLLAWQAVASAAVARGELDVSTIISARVHLYLGRKTGSAFTSGWPNLRVEGSVSAAGNSDWIPFNAGLFQPFVGASIVNTTLNGAILAAAASMVVTSGSNIAVGDLLFLGHTSDSSKYEVVRVKAVSGTTVTFENACEFAHDNGCQITDQAELYAVDLDLLGVQRLAVQCDNAGSGQDIYVAAYAGTCDSF